MTKLAMQWDDVWTALPLKSYWSNMIIEEYKLCLETSYMPLKIKASKIEAEGVEENKKNCPMA